MIASSLVWQSKYASRNAQSPMTQSLPWPRAQKEPKTSRLIDGRSKEPSCRWHWSRSKVVYSCAGCDRFEAIVATADKASAVWSCKRPLLASSYFLPLRLARRPPLRFCPYLCLHLQLRLRSQLYLNDGRSSAEPRLRHSSFESHDRFVFLLLDPTRSSQLATRATSKTQAKPFRVQSRRKRRRKCCAEMEMKI